MLDNFRLEKILFLDIETVPQVSNFSELKEPFSGLWEKKSIPFRKENETAADVYQRAGIYAEFGKIICISAGMLYQKDERRIFRMKSFFGHDEKEILISFAALLNKLSGYTLCAHNGKEFDFPFIARRMLIHGVPLPELLDIAGKKPWETSFLDTMELWKFGDYKNYTSLNLLAAVFNIPSPKDDIDGSMVSHVYYVENDLARIVKYCEKDVITIAQLIMRFRNESLIAEGDLERI